MFWKAVSTEHQRLEQTFWGILIYENSTQRQNFQISGTRGTLFPIIPPLRTPMCTRWHIACLGYVTMYPRLTRIRIQIFGDVSALVSWWSRKVLAFSQNSLLPVTGFQNQSEKQSWPWRSCCRYVLKHNYTHFYPNLYPILCPILNSILYTIQPNFKLDMMSSRTVELAVQIWCINCSIFRLNCFIYSFSVFYVLYLEIGRNEHKWEKHGRR